MDSIMTHGNHVIKQVQLNNNYDDTSYCHKKASQFFNELVYNVFTNILMMNIFHHRSNLPHNIHHKRTHFVINFISSQIKMA
jgi:hypothetical protein